MTVYGQLYGHSRWYFESIFGTKYVEENCHKSLVDFLQESPQLYWKYPTKVMMCLSTNSLNHQFFTTATKISNLQAYESFGIEMMEDAVERTVASMLLSEYRERMIEKLF